MHPLTGSAARAAIGPGRLVLVVGPSGAGKDTLIRAARDHLASDSRFVFPRRTITRPPSASEDNDACEPGAFDRLEAEGGFAVSWRAHGHRYGIPTSIDAAIRQGRTVICNVSRTVVQPLRWRYGHVVSVEITAPPAVLAARLACRGRPDDGDLALRLDRAAEIEPTDPDLTIVNAGALYGALACLLDLLSATTARDPVAIKGCSGDGPVV